MPVEFVRKNSCIDIREQIVCDSTKLLMAYDGSGRRVSKTRMRKAEGGDWETELVTHYTGIGTEVRENYHNGTPSETKVVVNMPQGLGRYGADDAVNSRGNGRSFEWYLKNHLGSTMLVYGTQWVDDENLADVGAPLAAYDYRAFGEQVDLTVPAEKVTENFTGKEKDDETELNYFGARYLDPMLGLWTSVDPVREYHSPYIYLRGNPINLIDPTGMAEADIGIKNYSEDAYDYINSFEPTEDELTTFVNTYDRFEGLTVDDLRAFFSGLQVKFGGEPKSEGMNGFYKHGEDAIYLTTYGLDMNDDAAEYDMRLRSSIFHESVHYINDYYGRLNNGNRPYPDEQYPQKGFNGGSRELGKEFEYRAYGKDY
ncbi:MAG: RHS repeat-associated core domain-containing protein [Fibrobacter sp.]|nr:RHS repeat-associated core domain-containing protein [Fibrobacter sp.]